MKVVCIINFAQFDFSDGNEPKKDEVVTHNGASLIADHFYILEYPKDINGRVQSFWIKHFVPLDEYLEGVNISEQVNECLTRELQEV